MPSSKPVITIFNPEIKLPTFNPKMIKKYSLKLPKEKEIKPLSFTDPKKSDFYGFIHLH